MRIPYPERIPLAGAASFAGLLVIAQLLEHTQPIFSVLCFVFIMFATIAFNLAGGLFTPAGAFIFFNAVLSLILGLLVKVFLGEPADSNLLNPLRAIAVYTAGMFGLLVAAYVAGRFRPTRPLISKLFPLGSLRSTYIGAVMLGVAFKAYVLTDPQLAPGSILTIVRNTDNLLPFALMLGVIYTVVSTDGRRSLTPGLACLFVLVNLINMLSFSKQAFFTPILCWVLGAAVSQYRLKPINFVVVPLLLVLGVHYGTPYEQVGKGALRTGSAKKDISVAVDLLTHMDRTQAMYQADSTAGYGITNYYNQPEGLFDRLEMISIDALLIAQTDREGPFGFEPTVEGWENVIPHFLWPNKPVPYFGNTYAHQIGIIPNDDLMTSVSFSSAADAYHEGFWYGVFIVEPLCFAAIFIIFSWLVGSVRDHPAVLLLIVTVAHAGPESGMTGAMGLLLYAILALGIAFACRYLLPVVASALESPTLPPPFIAASAAD